MSKLNQLAIFSIDEHQYALPLSVIERIVRVVEITPLPKTPAIVLGVINVRGRIIPVVNIRRRFGLPAREISLSDRLIITNASKLRIAILADNVFGLMEYPENEETKADEIFPGIEYIMGIIKKEDTMIHILDLDRILSFGEKASLDDAIKKNIGDNK